MRQALHTSDLTADLGRVKLAVGERFGWRRINQVGTTLFSKPHVTFNVWASRRKLVPCRRVGCHR